MKNLWSDKDAEAAIRHYAKQGVNADLALRVYTTRLLGGEPKLVLHGGGNTSVKTEAPDFMGNPTHVLCVKGSGWDMGDIEPPGLPAVRLDPLREMARLRKLSDEEMINAQRVNLLDASSPNPSVETLLHAFLPHKFIDHTHANAVLALSDQPNGDDVCQKVFGDRVGYVPYIMPGFDLAKKAKQVFEENPRVEGLILFKHGIFSFGDTAKQAYSRMIRLVSMAEKHIKTNARKPAVSVKLPKSLPTVVDIAPILRGATTFHGKPMVLDFRTSKAIRTFVDGKNIRRYSQQGTVTPDHVIRTKHKPLIAPAPHEGKLEAFKSEVEKAVSAYAAEYHAYFKRNNAKQKIKKTELDPMPRIILVPGMGLFGLGANAKAAAVAADLAENNVDVINNAEAMSTYAVIPERDIFDLEYWSLEQAKLGKGAEKPLARKVVVVTGAGSGIGAATAKAFAAQGAEVCVLDLNGKAAAAVATDVGGLAVQCDVTDPASVKTAFDWICETYGGVDITVSNAGAAWQGCIGDVDDSILRQSFELNFWAHQSVAQRAVSIMRQQGTGGCLLFNTSKQAVNPGQSFGPYGLPKAATLFLMRQYALDHGADGIRANAVNADRIRSGLLDDKMIASRSKARGVSETDYMGGNLLKREVTADDVAQAFVNLALAESTTAAVVTVDGGNIAAALR